MGKMGRWIDGLTDEQKDRIVRGQRWRDQLVIDADGRKCLVGHAAGYQVKKRANGNGTAAFRVGCEVYLPDTTPTGSRFDRLCGRFGLERIVRACKQRAAKGNDKINVEVDLRELEKADAEPQLQSA